jgi:protein KRI1
LQEYYDLDCEDFIADGTLKTRFKYVTVQKETYGLTDEEIYLLDDKQLNKLVSLKKLRPYRDLDEFGNKLPEEQIKKAKPNEHRVRKLKAEYKEELEQKRRLVRENQVANLQLQKEQLTGTSTHALSKAERK